MRISDWSSDVCSSDLVVDRLAVDEQDPLVAVDDLRQVALRHRQVAAAVGERLEDDVDVGLAGADAEDRAPAHAVQRLEHRVAVLADEGLERGGIAADHGGGRSEEHTSELQSLMRISYAVFCLKKKRRQYAITEYLHVTSIERNALT